MTISTANHAENTKVLDTLNAELSRMDQLLEDPNCDHARVLEQAFKVIQLMSRMLGNMEKEYVLDQESVLFVKAKELKGTYNTWSVLALTIVSSSVTIGGGFVGMGAAIPGTTLGQTLGNASPNALGWLGNAAWAKKLGSIGQGMGAVGQGSGGFTSLMNNSNEAKRTVFQVVIEEVKRKRGDRDDAARQMRDQSYSAANNCRQAIQAIHQAAQQILSARG
ncbi:hypothetical protein [Waddlia chondrophila]|uniref:Putative membrane protein n=2 Tax=Waddlia chondrophila TaxID=71667 RepID=D6YW10_WADCW|nr:hypothetical protein [Waddlia chondrophila]ADI38321.1 putative membrane protein [Waddlia chondrophila WSU 86-1044]